MSACFVHDDSVALSVTGDFDAEKLKNAKLVVVGLDALLSTWKQQNIIESSAVPKETLSRSLRIFADLTGSPCLAIPVTSSSPGMVQHLFDEAGIAWKVAENPGVFCNGALVLGKRGAVEHRASIDDDLMQAVQDWAAQGDGSFDFEDKKYQFAVTCVTENQLLFLPNGKLDSESKSIAENWAMMWQMTIADIATGFDWKANPVYQVNLLLESPGDLLKEHPTSEGDGLKDFSRVKAALLEDLQRKLMPRHTDLDGKHAIDPWHRTLIARRGVSIDCSLNCFIHAESVKDELGFINVGSEVLVVGGAAFDHPMFDEWGDVPDYNSQKLEKTQRPGIRALLSDCGDEQLYAKANVKNEVHEILAAVVAQRGIAIGESMDALVADDKEASTIEVVAPAGPPIAAPRPMRLLKPSCVDLSDSEDTQDCLNLSGSPRKAVPVLRQRKRQASPSYDKKKKSPFEGDATEEEMQWDLVLSPRAAQETALIEVLQTREFTFDELGRVEIDDHVQAAALARQRADLPGDLGLDDIEAPKSNESMEPKSPRSARAHRKRRASECDGDAGLSYDIFCDWRQRQLHLNFIRQQLQEQSLVGAISASFKNLVSASTVNPLAAGLAAEVEPIAPGSEPPPSPALQRRRRHVSGDEEQDTAVAGVDDRYLHACSELGLHSRPMVLKALRAVECGGSSFPPEFTNGSYLGDRGAQALLQTLVGDDTHEISELRDLRMLDLHGQGIGNEAAALLAQFLARCPHLRVMNLSKNHISESGLQKLIEEVKVHPSLDVLNIDMNPVPSWQRVRLKQLLQSRRDGPVPGLKVNVFKGGDFQQACRP